MTWRPKSLPSSWRVSLPTTSWFNQSIGICPFLGVSKKIQSGVGMGMAVTFVLAVSAVVCYFLYHYILVPLGIEYLQTITFILIIAALVQMLDIVLKKTSPAPLHVRSAVYPGSSSPPNCAVLFTANYGITQNYDLLYTFINAVCVGLGFTLALILMAGHPRAAGTRGHSQSVPRVSHRAHHRGHHVAGLYRLYGIEFRRVAWRYS